MKKIKRGLFCAECNCHCYHNGFSFVKIENIKYFFRKIPIFLKITYFEYEFIKSFENKPFEEMVMSSLINIQKEDKRFFLIPELTTVDSKCPFENKNSCSLKEKLIPLKCKLFPFQSFMPIVSQDKVLHITKHFCPDKIFEKDGVFYTDKNEILFDSKEYRIHNAYLEYYYQYFKNLQKLSNNPLILKNVSVLLNNDSAFLDLHQANPVNSFIVPLRVNKNDLKKLKIFPYFYKYKQLKFINQKLKENIYDKRLLLSAKDVLKRI